MKKKTTGKHKQQADRDLIFEYMEKSPEEKQGIDLFALLNHEAKKERKKGRKQ
jgi:hypothetical protein